MLENGFPCFDDLSPHFGPCSNNVIMYQYPMDISHPTFVFGRLKPIHPIFK
jgi:hypothetical protein